tara:strand:+ start:244 stop:699 length:456 start_codon:yes stop_codon:yes gene_type:complete
MNKLFPEVADNNYTGAKSAYYFFIGWTLLNTWRSIIHFLAEDGGLNSIANIIILNGDPDPNPVVYLFGSLWGEVQVLLCLIFWIVFFRYKSLIPLMYLVSLLEWSMRLIIIKPMKGLDDIYTNGFTPGSELSPVAVLLLIIFFMLSLKNSK